MILLLTNADTEILALRSVVEGLPEGFPPVAAANPDHLDVAPDVAGMSLVVVRLLGGRRAWEGPFDDLRSACVAQGVPFLAVAGEATPDAELATLSTVPSATVSHAFAYLAAGGLANLEHLLRFLADTVLLEGFGFDPPEEVPLHGVWDGWQPDAPLDPQAPAVGIVFYRAHLVAGNTNFVEGLCQAVADAGGRPVPVYTYSLRPEGSTSATTADTPHPANTHAGAPTTGTHDSGTRDAGAPHPAAPDTGSPITDPPEAQRRVPAIELLREHGVAAVITSVLAMGSTEGDDWEVPELASLGVSVVQAPSATRPRQEWEASDDGLSPVDVAMTVAIPEFDGRIVSVPVSFKEVVDDGLDGHPDDGGHRVGDRSPVTAYRTHPERAARAAGLAVRLARLSRTPPQDKRVAIVLSAYPTKRARLGNAVALDTPASVVDLLHAMRAAGYRVDAIPATGDELMADLADRLTYDVATMTPAQQAAAAGRMSTDRYRDWFGTLPADLRDSVVEQWGEPPGEAYVHDGHLLFSGLDLGGVLVAVQAPRGFGGNAAALYHSPDLPPTHHYLAFYRWLDEVWGADAMVHAGKHGTLEWLPGKSVGMSASCAPDAALGDLPLVYPFVVNDPGEGTQAKRRAHAVLVDHLLPPMTRAETYDELAKLESLIEEYDRVRTLDPAKLAAIRTQVWDLLVEARLNTDLGIVGRPEGDGFDDLLTGVDGYLCELKDARIRGGLHILGRVPEGEAQLDLVLSLTRLPQGSAPSLRDTVAAQLSLSPTTERTAEADAIDARARGQLADLQAAGWRYEGDDPTLAWVCHRLVPALARTTDEIGNILVALDGGYVPAGPSGAPTRGMAHVLPTGRNFYSVDPKALPSPLAWEVGQALAARLIERHVAETGDHPRTVGLVVWGTAAMRTSGDDVAEALALLGVRPTWHEWNRRVTGLEAIPLEELGRPRVDVAVRISGFFRDAFPNLVDLLDDAVALVAGLDEPPDMNPVRASGTADPRVFGPKPGGYGSGISGLLESRDWRTDDDLAAVYEAWGGWGYRRGEHGVPARDAMRRRFATIDVAVKNQDNREHDIFDSDDYLQDHGGMVAMVRSLTGRNPRAWFGDSSDPASPKVRSLAEEAARVVRTRVINPKWIEAMQRHGYKGAFEMSATVDFLFGYDATAGVVENWMYERVTQAYVADPQVRKFFEQSNPWALTSICERLLEADERDLWHASADALATLRSALLEAEGWEESR